MSNEELFYYSYYDNVGDLIFAEGELHVILCVVERARMISSERRLRAVTISQRAVVAQTPVWAFSSRLVYEHDQR